MTKDFLVTIKVRNGRLIKKIRDAGFDSAAAFCRKYGINVSAVCALATFRSSPLIKSGWSTDALNICTALGCQPDDIWPEHLAQLKRRQGAVEFEADIADLKRLEAPREAKVDRFGMTRLLGCLTPREARVLALRYGLNGVGEHTADEIGEQQNIGRQRVYQIEQKALSKLRRKAYRMHARSTDDYLLPN